MAVLGLPSVLNSSASAPTAVLLLARPAPVESLLESAKEPTAVLSSPPLLKARALTPTAVLSSPLRLRIIAAAPTAVLESAVLRASVPAPTAVLKLAPPTKKSERQPTPVFPVPVVRFSRARQPS